MSDSRKYPHVTQAWSSEALMDGRTIHHFTQAAVSQQFLERVAPRMISLFLGVWGRHNLSFLEAWDLLVS